MAALLTAGLLLGSGMGFAQTKPGTIPDAQVEANVLKALAGAPELADQSIMSTTVYGVVTLNGTVRDEPSRDLAEHLVANTAGVQKVIDQLVIGVTPAAVANDPQQGTNPNLQSDGTMAPSQGQNQQPQVIRTRQERRRAALLRRFMRHRRLKLRRILRSHIRRPRRIRGLMGVRRILSRTHNSRIRLSDRMLLKRVEMRLWFRPVRCCGFASIRE